MWHILDVASYKVFFFMYTTALLSMVQKFSTLVEYS